MPTPRFRLFTSLLLGAGASAIVASAAHAEDPPGRKPNYVKCDPARPELPCTPDAAPVRPVVKPKPAKAGKPGPKTKPGRKPDYVKCDPAQPNMPCTPDRFEDLPKPGRDAANDHPGRKPDYVKCDPARPDMPCTPDVAPPDLDKPEKDVDVPGRKPHYVKCDPARPERPCTPDAPITPPQLPKGPPPKGPAPKGGTKGGN